jgi:hypothetical protein
LSASDENSAIHRQIVEIKKLLADPEFVRLEQEALEAQRKLDKAKAEIRDRFPLPQDMYWCAYTNRIRPMLLNELPDNENE